VTIKEKLEWLSWAVILISERYLKLADEWRYLGRSLMRVWKGDRQAWCESRLVTDESSHWRPWDASKWFWFTCAICMIKRWMIHIIYVNQIHFDESH
jgi:hypothetical protein